MHYANILVSVDLDGPAPDRIRLAAGLAHRFEATLTGAAAHPVPVPILVHDVYDATIQEKENERVVHGLLERAHAVFAGNAGEGIRTDWRPAFAGPITHLVEQARAADLVVVGRRGPDDDNADGLGVPPGPVLMEAGRPVLVVPPGIEHLKAARIVVAWKDGPEARRAVSGALGFIRHADQVFVVTAGDGARFEGAEDVAGHLARHGASATTHLLKAAAGDGDAVLRFAREHEADLMVMGGYGHSRLREWAFGGVTREILQTAPVCCLMCH
ncbi:universal stress protein [Methylobacterium sp. NEAU K]|uniref:universal stress protein n=1 Tax=Methylobacterium sp. NEAU K TaxID=3064946 RepID=UPI0027377887|nr:universal stress protein [Methylobacterium sp. NEAU K]MDP4003342.1 universal stress protein [Methylobacterium sp. NEAU K]